MHSVAPIGFVIVCGVWALLGLAAIISLFV